MKLKSCLKYIGIIVVSILMMGAAWFTWIGGTAYLYASYIESKWVEAAPKTKNELEAHLRFYSQRLIDPKESLWGKDYNLNAGERMVQYRILWNKNCPLDVVFTASNDIQHIYTSYE